MAQGRGRGAVGGLGGMGARRVRRAFALAEAGAVVMVLVVASALLMVGAGQSRRSAGLAGSLANLRKIGETTGAYAADFDDGVWSFSWSSGNSPSEYEDLRYGNNTEAVMFQSVDIVRRLTGRDDHPRYDDSFGPLYLGPLVLADYLQDSLPAEWMVSPGDTVRRQWAADPDHAPDFGDSKAYAATFGPFGSSYIHMPAFIAPDQKIGTRQTIYQYSPTHYLMWIPPMQFGGRRSAEVYFPAQKVMMAERESFYFGPRPVYYLHPTARVPVLMVDGAASPRSTADSNASWWPNVPNNSQLSTRLTYRPRPPFEAPAVDETAVVDEDLESAYKWTRGGLSGIDFAGEREE